MRTYETYDLSPLRRSTVGFDRLFNLANEAIDASDNYPLYDIERIGEDQYQISFALAGFTPDDVTITAEQSSLTVEGRQPRSSDRAYLYRGIPAGWFRRVFNLSEYIKVKDATFENGVLRIVLVREVPEAMKPRRIAIESAGNDNQNDRRNQAA